MRITGTPLDDTLFGSDGKDIFLASTGSDTMSGGRGHDTYYVEDMFDEVIEEGDHGTDWVYTTIDYLLPEFVEHMKALGTADINLFGNDEDNTLIGNRGNNVLSGGAGADVMNGGAGNDVYYVNQFSLDGINKQKGVVDVIIDSSGFDTVIGFFNDPAFEELYYVMQRGLESLNFTGSETNMTIVGNSSRNIIITGDLDDTVDGGKGADTMDAGIGKNTFFIDNKGDVIIDNDDDFDGGTGEPIEDAADTAIVTASKYTFAPDNKIEFITAGEKGGKYIMGSDSKNIMTGNTKANTLHGGDGDDTLMGGGGSDKLYGGDGADVFAFTSDVYVDVTKKPTAVKIMDFNRADGDILDISDIISYEDGTIISSYIQITDKGKDSIVKVNINAGGDGPENWLHVATLVGVNGLTGEVSLFNTGNLRLENEPL